MQTAYRFRLKHQNKWVDMYCCGCRSEVSFSVGTHLIPHPKKVSAHQKPPLCSLMRTTFNGRKKKKFFSACVSNISSIGLSEGWQRWGGCFLREQLQWGSYCCCWWCLWVWDSRFSSVVFSNLNSSVLIVFSKCKELVY